MAELYRRIWQATGRQQIVLIVLSLVIAVLATAPLQFQKLVVNGLAGDMTRTRLFALCAGYFSVLILIYALKIALRYRSSILSESVVRRIRGLLYDSARQGKAQSEQARGTLITTITDEADEVGRFAGDAIAAPMLQFGTLVAVVVFVAETQPLLGLFMFLLILPQVFLVLYLQRFVNARVKTKVQTLRGAMGTISKAELDEASDSVRADFDSIFEIQREIIKFKLSLKFILNALSGVGTVGILLFGGLLYLNEQTDIGSVVASLSAFQRVNGPWQTLIAFYRQLSAVRVRFELLLLRL
jgi:ABC-type multidrug transport system fused ATPase/permease subunit